MYVSKCCMVKISKKSDQREWQDTLLVLYNNYVLTSTLLIIHQNYKLLAQKNIVYWVP